MFSNFYRAVKKKLKERMDDFQVLCCFPLVQNSCLSMHVMLMQFCDIIILLTWDDLKHKLVQNICSSEDLNMISKL